MIKIFNNFFNNKKNESNAIETDLEIVSGLLIEAAYSDGNIDETEIYQIKLILLNFFSENENEVSTTLDTAIENRNNSKSLFYYTSKINKQFSEKRKLILIEMLWKIILSDGKIHDYETSLIRRISGLLYISDVNSGNARKRALDSISTKK